MDTRGDKHKCKYGLGRIRAQEVKGIRADGYKSAEARLRFKDKD